ncbi:hypothetical protein [Trebonia kvetii]|uniref:hypothetical protein n=1 Tax=Trebonia kvetii TaxID=2480626 RepID=UPI001C9E659F|nr:hypothetical protein [Trebonia kvetii]
MGTVDVARFVSDGFVKLPGVVPRAVADAARALLWQQAGLSPQDPAGWKDCSPCYRMSGLMTRRPASGSARSATRPRTVHAADEHRGGEPRFMAQTPSSSPRR